MHGTLVLGLAIAASLVGIAPAAALDVTRFGAVPNDGKDDTAAFLEAFRQAKTAGDWHIVIPRGIYNLRADGNPAQPGTLFPISGAEGIVIDGRGAEFAMTGAGSVLSFTQCKNVTLRGLTVDWQRPPFSEGMVTASEARSFDVQVPSGYPVHGGEPVLAFMSYDPVTRLPTGRDLDVYGSVERTELVGPQMLRVHLNRDIPVPVGTLLVLRHEVYGHTGIAFVRCANVHVSDTTLYTAPGMGLIAVNCTDVSLRRFNVRMRPGSGRLMSATADATHFGGCKGTVTLEDCTFEGMGDDGANIKSGLYLIVRKRVDDHTVVGQHNLKMVDLPDPGDTMEMSHVDTLVPFASGKVRSATLEPGEEHMHRVEFEEPLPADLREGDVLGNATRAPKLRMRHCTVAANRARGVLCQTRDAVIENCTFRNCTGAGVLVLTEVVYFFESIGTRNVTVRNCVFDNCNRGAAEAEGALAALAWLKDSAYPQEPGVHRDVTFEGNRIVGTDESAIFAVGVDGLTIRGNRIEGACENPVRETGKYAIRVMNCARVSVQGNTIDPALQGKGMIDPIRQTPPAEPAR